MSDLFVNKGTRTIGTQNITETGSNEFCGFYILFDLLIAGLHIFSAILYCSHHVTWVDCLIRGNHDKLHHIMFASQIGQVFSSFNMVRMACDGFSSINGTCLYAAA
jgi:hypothetical protein